MVCIRIRLLSENLTLTVFLALRRPAALSTPCCTEVDFEYRACETILKQPSLCSPNKKGYTPLANV